MPTLEKFRPGTKVKLSEEDLCPCGSCEYSELGRVFTVRAVTSSYILFVEGDEMWYANKNWIVVNLPIRKSKFVCWSTKHDSN